MDNRSVQIIEVWIIEVGLQSPFLYMTESEVSRNSEKHRENYESQLHTTALNMIQIVIY